MFCFANVTGDHYNNISLFGTYRMKSYPSNNNLSPIPGKQVKLNIQLLDELSEILPDNYVIKIDGHSSLKVESLYSSNGSTKIFGKHGENATITVSTQRPIKSVYC